MDYKTKVSFTGSSSAAMEAARTQFIANGFKIDQSSDEQLVVTGPGMYNNQQNPIVGISHATITISSSAIEICAELGGVKFMQMFLYIFPPALGIFLALVFACTPNFPRRASLTPILTILPWVVISPLMARWLKNRTTKAVDTLVHNMVNVGSLANN
ncbi:MAG: hypothetical protein GY845_15385 [Planctomycetes bacterium]|nr:hypothetical protein [Planctomycetota bacterium]